MGRNGSGQKRGFWMRNFPLIVERAAVHPEASEAQLHWIISTCGDHVASIFQQMPRMQWH